jgi:hypothetical protein
MDSFMSIPRIKVNMNRSLFTFDRLIVIRVDGYRDSHGLASPARGSDQSPYSRAARALVRWRAGLRLRRPTIA